MIFIDHTCIRKYWKSVKKQDSQVLIWLRDWPNHMLTPYVGVDVISTLPVIHRRTEVRRMDNCNSLMNKCTIHNVRVTHCRMSRWWLLTRGRSGSTNRHYDWQSQEDLNPEVNRIPLAERNYISLAEVNTNLPRKVYVLMDCLLNEWGLPPQLVCVFIPHQSRVLYYTHLN
jgi:hypothetical protein